MEKLNCCVICTDDNGYIRSVNSFQLESEANLFVQKDASEIYEKVIECPESAIEVCPGYAKVSGEGFFEWKVYPMTAH